MECGTKKKLDCTDWENNYVLLETPGYPAMYQNKDKCIWKIQIPKESGTWIYCEEFSLNEGDYLFVGNQRYFGHKNYANIEPFQKSKQHTLRLKFKSNWRERNNGFKCWVTCWPTDPSQTPAWTSTTTTNGDEYWTTNADGDFCVAPGRACYMEEYVGLYGTGICCDGSRCPSPREGETKTYCPSSYETTTTGEDYWTTTTETIRK